MMADKILFTKTTRPFPDAEVPEIVYDENPAWIKLYNTVWHQAWDHVYESNAMPQSPYMGEGCGTNRIWIWDTCFMVNYCRYAVQVFPGIQSLDNFYRIMHDGEPTVIKVHHPDNPPLFAWTEYEYFRLTGDFKRLEQVLLKKQYLQKHYEWLETPINHGTLFPYAGIHVLWEKIAGGYMWTGISSGMDNTPRGRNKYDMILWLDALAQQGLSALYIAKIADLLNADVLKRRFMDEYLQKKELMQKYWDDVDGIFYDRCIFSDFSKVVTPAAFWPAMAEMASPRQVDRMVQLLTDPNKLGGVVPCPSVSRDDPDFQPNGCYWRGGVWLPTTYMVVKALEKYGKFELAADIAAKTLSHMSRTFEEFEPHTIWEAYSPTKAKPATTSTGEALSRPNFCGWSALGPISLFIENIIGLHTIDAGNRIIKWALCVEPTGKCGIKRLRFGNIITNLIYENGVCHVSSNLAYTLELNDQVMFVQPGENRFICSKIKQPVSF